MDRNDFFRLLEQKGIRSEIVSFDNSINDGFNIRKNKLNWETFTRERGHEFDSMGFPSESDALQYMFEQVCRYYDILQKAGFRIEQINQLQSGHIQLGDSSAIESNQSANKKS